MMSITSKTCHPLRIFSEDIDHIAITIKTGTFFVFCLGAVYQLHSGPTEWHVVPFHDPYPVVSNYSQLKDILHLQQNRA